MKPVKSPAHRKEKRMRKTIKIKSGELLKIY
jgi:hypothetical protein